MANNNNVNAHPVLWAAERAADEELRQLLDSFVPRLTVFQMLGLLESGKEYVLQRAYTELEG